MTNLSS